MSAYHLMKGGPLKTHLLVHLLPPKSRSVAGSPCSFRTSRRPNFSPKKHLSPSWTFPMHHLQLQSLRSPNSNCCMLSSCDSQPNNFSILRVDFFGASGKHRGKMKDNFLGVAEWFSFKKKERYLSVKSLVYKSCSIRKIIWTNHPPPFFFVFHLNWFQAVTVVLFWAPPQKKMENLPLVGASAAGRVTSPRAISAQMSLRSCVTARLRNAGWSIMPLIRREGGVALGGEKPLDSYQKYIMIWKSWEYQSASFSCFFGFLD